MIEEILTLEKLQHHWESMDPKDVAGKAGHATQCPVARYLVKCGFELPFVLTNEAICQDQNDVYFYQFPRTSVLAQLIHRIDAQGTGTSVTARECLDILHSLIEKEELVGSGNH